MKGLKGLISSSMLAMATALFSTQEAARNRVPRNPESTDRGYGNSKHRRGHSHPGEPAQPNNPAGSKYRRKMLRSKPLFHV